MRSRTGIYVFGGNQPSAIREFGLTLLHLFVSGLSVVSGHVARFSPASPFCRHIIPPSVPAVQGTGQVCGSGFVSVSGLFVDDVEEWFAVRVPAQVVEQKIEAAGLFAGSAATGFMGRYEHVVHIP